jgi:transketolase
MRNAACDAWVDLSRNQSFVFLTGDLGFCALEPLQKAIGPRFINAGIAEQNMVSVAAGLACGGERVWVYSIAPFCYARPFEQIRNDVCLHDFPVKLVGNGGGYGYGVMGASHHAIEDYGTLLGLQNMHAFVPAFSADVSPAVATMAALKHPAYLRLGLCEKPKDVETPGYAPWRAVLRGDGPVVVVVGTLAGSLWESWKQLPNAERPELWVLCELPATVDSAPKELVDALAHKRRLAIVEEHVEHGSFGSAFSLSLMRAGYQFDEFHHFCARGYPSSTYGSQRFHRRESGLDPESISSALRLGCRSD